jgi:C4-dicarboxylate transporter DctM subunit
VAVAYAFVVDLVFYRDIRVRDVLGIFADGAVISSQVLVIVAAASLFAWVLNYTEVTEAAVATLRDAPLPGWLMLLGVNAVVLLAGCFIDAISIYYIFVPILLPIVLHLGVSKLHFGVIMAVNLAIGQATPPVGVNLFVACGISKVSLNRIARAAVPLIAVEVAALLLITYLPWLSTYLPSLLP